MTARSRLEIGTAMFDSNLVTNDGDGLQLFKVQARDGVTSVRKQVSGEGYTTPAPLSTPEIVMKHTMPKAGVNKPNRHLFSVSENEIVGDGVYPVTVHTVVTADPRASEAFIVRMITRHRSWFNETNAPLFLQGGN